MVVCCDHELTFLDKLYRADAAMTRHLYLFDQLHLAHIPKVNQAIIIGAGKDTIRILLQTCNRTKVAVLEQALMLCRPYVPKPD